MSGTAVAASVDIDVRFGTPIRAAKYLCGDDREPGEKAISSIESLREPARRLAEDALRAVQGLTSINLDHLLAGLFRNQSRRSAFTERACRERLFLATLKSEQKGLYLRPGMNKEAKQLLYDEPHVGLQESLNALVSVGVVGRVGMNAYRRADLMGKRESRLCPFLLKERGFLVESSGPPCLDKIARHTALLPDILVRRMLRGAFRREDRRLFEYQYARHYSREESKSPVVGAPFLLCPWRVRGGVVLAHGYTAAPLEVRALAQHLFEEGFAVYGVRLEGHGTAPEDLAARSWEDWYTSLNQGYAVMRAITNKVFLGGFSTGGCLALVGAARKQNKIQGVFSICAPRYVRSYSIHLVPSIMSVNTLFKKLGQPRYVWEYVDNHPENRHINYFKNPMTGIRQLTAAIDAMEDALPQTHCPTLVIQASKDTTVNPVSGSLIFEKLASRKKQLVMLERDRHGIINGEGSAEVYSIVSDFLKHVLDNAHDDRNRLP